MSPEFVGSAAQTAIGNGIHVAFTAENVAGTWTAKLFVDGVEKASDSAAMTISANTQYFRLGYKPGGGYLGGDMDEPAVYQKVLSDARILAHAQAAGVA